MIFLRNTDDDRSDEELENVFAGADEDLNDDMEANIPNVSRVRAALPNIPAPRNGGMYLCQPWTEGPRNPALRTNRPKTGLCYCSMTVQQKVFLRSEADVGDAWLIKTKSIVPLSLSSVKIKDDIATLGLDSVFDVRIGGIWANLFNSPDAVLLAEIRAHEEQLGHACEYNKKNLYDSRVFLENSIEVSLQQRSDTSLREGDGGPALWMSL